MAYVNTFQDAKRIGLDKSAIVLTDYGGTDIEVLGYSKSNCMWTSVNRCLSPNILSYKDSMRLQLVHRINSLSVLAKTFIIDKYPYVFSDDLGSLPGQYTIQLKTNAQPVQQSPQPVPVHLKNSYKYRFG